jgi:hypothetical protein
MQGEDAVGILAVPIWLAGTTAAVFVGTIGGQPVSQRAHRGAGGSVVADRVVVLSALRRRSHLFPPVGRRRGEGFLRCPARGHGRFRAHRGGDRARILARQHVMRYASEDDFGLPETVFLICWFWLIDVLWDLGGRD